MKNMRFLSLIVSCLWLAQRVDADEEVIEEAEIDYAAIFGTEKIQSIAAGHPQPQYLSPSVTSVMTSKDIESIGARRLQDVLEYLPGVHTSLSRAGNNLIGFRGVTSEANAEVLILINGVPVRSNVNGGKPIFWTMPVKNISHIEIIRGPGSMLYGGDAITGVINVVLKTGRQLKGGDVGTFIGTQNTFEGWAEYGIQKGDWEVVFSAQGGTSTGDRDIVNRDAQTAIDEVFGTHASNAPGYTNNGRNDIDARMDIKYQDWLTIRAGMQRFNHVQTGVGSAYALDNNGFSSNDLYNFDITAQHNPSQDLDIESRFYFIGQDINFNNLNIFPAGTLGGLLPQGAITDAGNFQGTTAFNSQLNYTGLKKHHFTLGTGVSFNWQSDIRTVANYQITPTLIQQIPPTDITRIKGEPSNDRWNIYALFQDEWNFAPDWTLTTGLRYDYYSEVSSGLSPRVALVWNAMRSLTVKWLYSRAFRPPSFLEKDQTALLSGVKSETNDTVEFQIEKQWSPRLMTSANVYWFELRNLIVSSSDSSLTDSSVLSPNPVSYSNADPIRGAGFETEARYKLNEKLSLSGNYSFHHVSNTNNTGLLPEHMVKALLQWEFTRAWSLGVQLDWIGERKRPAFDPRGNLGNYFIAGLTLSTQLAKPVEFTIRVNNLFGANANEPSSNAVLLPGDIPVNDRAILGQVKWAF